MRAILLKLTIPLIPTIIEILIEALRSMAARTDNNIDDALVATVEVNKENIISELKDQL